MLELKYGAMTKTIGGKFTYLGMDVEVDLRKKCIYVTMLQYVKKIVEDWKPNKKYSTPATNDLFVIDNSSLKLGYKEQKRFHTFVAKLLYLAKRARPDILVCISFLTTRVTKATADDWTKLDRVIGFLNKTLTDGICLGAGSPETKLELHCYVDASFGVHHDMKSHTGIFVTLGRGPIYVGSSKQKIITKSTFESETVAVSDAGSPIVWAVSLLAELGYGAGPAVLFQDNAGAIAALKTGDIKGRNSKHIVIRNLWIVQNIRNGKFKIIWVKSEEMQADIFTKPLPGVKFVPMSKFIRGDN
jgi:hypothetical protein